MEEVISLIPIISNVGFPIAVALYFMIRFEKILKENTIAMRDMHVFLKTQMQLINNSKK